MSKSGSTFFSTIPKLSRDPLGIIALFIALTYAMASLVLGLGAHLTATQRWPLVIFLVAFPVVVLISFLWLVIKYNQKLYSPEDFRSDDSFLKTLKPGDQTIRDDENGDPPVHKGYTSAETHTKAININREFNSNAFRASIAEDLVLRDLEIEMKVPFRRQFGFKLKETNQVIQFHGIATAPDEFIAVEVKFLESKKIDGMALASQINQKLRLVNNSNIQSPVTGILIIVTENYTKQDLEIISREIEEEKQKYDKKIDVRFYDFNDLLRKYKIH